MTVSVQKDLFADESCAPVIDRSFATAKRVALDAHSWVEVVPGWLSGSKILLESLKSNAAWEQRDRRMFDQVFREPRLTATYPTLDGLTEPIVLDAVRALSHHYGVGYDGLWMNLYRDGKDSTGWHRDWPSCQRTECIVPVLTLGATRRFLIKPRKGGNSIVFKPKSGDLVVMGGRAQLDWVHGVPKEPGIADVRISVNFQSSAQARRDD